MNLKPLLSKKTTFQVAFLAIVAVLFIIKCAMPSNQSKADDMPDAADSVDTYLSHAISKPIDCISPELLARPHRILGVSNYETAFPENEQIPWDDLMRFCFPHLRKTQVIIVYRDEVQSQPEASLEVPASHEKVDSNSCCIYFKSGYRQVYPDYLSNGDVLAFLRSKKDDIKSLRIECWSSPEGSPSNNGLLAGFRAQCLKEYLMRELCLGSDSIETVACGEAWEGLLVEVMTSYEGSNRDALIKILSDDSMSGPQKKAAVRAMDSGNTWKVLVSSSMEKLRFARISW